MYPHERSLVKQLSNEKFALIGVNSDKDRDVLKEVLKEKNISWRSFWNGGSTSGPISSRWNVRAWPTIYVFDENGVIRFRDVRGADLDKAIETLFGEMGQTISIKHDEEEETTDAGAEKKDTKEKESKGAEPKGDVTGKPEAAKAGGN